MNEEPGMPTPVQQELRITELSLLNETIEIQQYNLGFLKTHNKFARRKSRYFARMDKSVNNKNSPNLGKSARRTMDNQSKTNESLL